MTELVKNQKSLIIQLRTEPLENKKVVYLGTMYTQITGEKIAKNIIEIEDIPQLTKALIDLVSTQQYQDLLAQKDSKLISTSHSNGLAI